MKKFAAAVSALLALVVSPSPGEAGYRQYSLAVSPMVGAQAFEGNQELETGPYVSLGLGYRLGERFDIESVVSYTDSENESYKNGVNIYGVRLDTLYHFNPDGRVVPYLAAGVGGLSFDSPRDSDEDVTLNYGLGLKIFLNDTFAIRGDVRHLLDWNVRDDHKSRELYNQVIASAGLVLHFGSPASPRQAAAETAALPAETVPAQPAAPAPVPIPAPVVELDSDGDGVVDSLDQCPNTPWGQVDAKGCPKDSDGDGVLDFLDTCPETAPGAKVDNRGCPETLPPVIDIRFKSGSAEIERAFDEELAKIAKFVQGAPDRRIVIEGHADSVGREAPNMELSLRRAKKVRQYLIDKFAVPAEQVETRGFGEAQPRDDNATQEGRYRNRRAIIHLAE